MRQKPRPRQLDRAIISARKYFNNERISRKTLRRPGRRPYACQVRFFVSAWLRAHTDFSYPMIAGLLHKKDHTTIMNGVRRAYELWGDDLLFQQAMRPKRQVTEGVFVNGEGWTDLETAA